MKIFKPQYKGIQNMPAEEKQLVVNYFIQWQANRTRPNAAHLKYLFNKYHEYVYKDPADMRCPSCVQFIFNYWKKKVTEWQTSP